MFGSGNNAVYWCELRYKVFVRVLMFRVFWGRWSYRGGGVLFGVIYIG